jgi:hypothetical protein
MLNKRFPTRPFGLATGLGAALLFPACGGNPITNPSPPPTTLAACTQTTVFQGGTAFPPSTLDTESFATSTTGRLEVTLDWTFPASPFGVYVVQGACDLQQFNARSCNFLLRSDSGPKPRKVSAPNVAAGSYSLLIANFGSQNESVSTQVVLSSSTCPPLAAATAQSQTHDLQIGGERTGILHH